VSIFGSSLTRSVIRFRDRRRPGGHLPCAGVAPRLLAHHLYDGKRDGQWLLANAASTSWLPGYVRLPLARVALP